MPNRFGSQPIEAFAPAKINLTLHVTGKRADGYHLLDSLVVFADLGDRLWLTPADEMSMEISGPFAEGVPADGRNLAWQAAELAGWTGHIALEKNLPHGGGIGGGSSDAAAVLRALDCRRDALTLGADVPVCLQGAASRMRGIGDVITPVEGFPSFSALLVNPLITVPTPAVFKALAWADNPAMEEFPAEHATQNQWLTWLGGCRNDLQVPAAHLAPDIDLALHDLRCTGGGQMIGMSGSGSTCFAIYPTLVSAKHAAFEVQSAHPDWWVRAVTLS